MFEAKIDASVLRECVEAITPIVDEGKLKIEADGFKLRAVDPANVAMVSFELQRDAFDEFQFEAKGGESGALAMAETEIAEKGGESGALAMAETEIAEKGGESGALAMAETEIGMDFVKLREILGIGGKEVVELALHEKLSIRMGSLDYTLSLLDPSSLRKEPKVPELEFPVQVIIETEEFRRTIRAAEKVGDHMVFGVDGEMFYMETEGEMDKLRLELRKEQLIHLTPGTLHSSYSLDYISAMSKGMSHADSITLNMGKDYPLQMVFEVADGKGKVSYLLAPRIESE
jgi:proliferating cell nuclear antigen